MSFGKNTCLLIFILLILHVSSAFSQNPDLIHLKREKTFLFFQKGIKSDSIAKNSRDVFYLIVPDSMKESLSIVIDNGRLRPAANDSLQQLEYLQGLKYEHLYQKSRDQQVATFRLLSLINGTSELAANKIRIRFFNKKDNQVMLENIFFYKK